VLQTSFSSLFIVIAFHDEWGEPCEMWGGWQVDWRGAQAYQGWVVDWREAQAYQAWIVD